MIQALGADRHAREQAVTISTASAKTERPLGGAPKLDLEKSKKNSKNNQ